MGYEGRGWGTVSRKGIGGWVYPAKSFTSVPGAELASGDGCNHDFMRRAESSFHSPCCCCRTGGSGSSGDIASSASSSPPPQLPAAT